MEHAEQVLPCYTQSPPEEVTLLEQRILDIVSIATVPLWNDELTQILNAIHGETYPSVVVHMTVASLNTRERLLIDDERRVSAPLEVATPSGLQTTASLN